MSPSTFTEHDISVRLRARKGSRTLAQLAKEIRAVTGLTVSIYHLSNVIHGRKSPGRAILAYLKLEREQTEPVYKAAKR